MNGTADQHDESNWDDLDAMLGLTPAPSKASEKAHVEPAKPAPEPVVKRAPVPEPVAQKAEKIPEMVKRVPVAETVAKKIEKIPEPVVEHDGFGFGHDTDIMDEAAAEVEDSIEVSPTEDTVLEESHEAFGNLEPAAPTEGSKEETADGEGGVKRRRRRRRRKKGPGEPGATPAAESNEENADDEETVEAAEREQPDFAEPTVEIVGEAAAEMDDDDENDGAPVAAVNQAEMDDDSTEPLPDWKVVAWTELVATLYRPQDR